jgi:hypothetical protein
MTTIAIGARLTDHRWDPRTYMTVIEVLELAFVGDVCDDPRSRGLFAKRAPWIAADYTRGEAA